VLASADGVVEALRLLRRALGTQAAHRDGDLLAERRRAPGDP